MKWTQAFSWCFLASILSTCHPAVVVKHVMPERRAHNDSLTIDINKADLLQSALLSKFYRDRGYALAWLENSRQLENARQFLGILENAELEGLRPEDYHVAEIKALLHCFADFNRLRDPALASRAATLELLLTNAFFAFNMHRAMGRTPLHKRDLDAYDAQHRLYLEALLIRALTQGEVLEATRAWTSADPRGLGLKIALRYYRTLADQGDWPNIPYGPWLAPGDYDPVRVPLLQARLAALGDYHPATTAEPYWDPGLQSALKQFQSRHQLPATGRLTPDTLKALNRPLPSIIRQLEINLERQRWLPWDLVDRYILVNIPSYELEANANGHTELAMNVVVGKKRHPTSVFASVIKAVVLNPAWVIPADILRQEQWPAIQQDPLFLERNHINVITGWGESIEYLNPFEVDQTNLAQCRFRQDPGPWNALGSIKFLAPNAYGIYLHGTPQRHLFSKRVRAFSHGCIRLENPLALAEYILDDPCPRQPEWLAGSWQAADEETINLDNSVALYVTYMTCVLKNDGLLHFYPDIYRKDKKLLAAWKQPAFKP